MTEAKSCKMVGQRILLNNDTQTEKRDKLRSQSLHFVIANGRDSS